MSELAIGIDLGGTKIEVVAIDPHGKELIRRRTATPKNDYRGTIEAIAGLVLGVEDELGTKGTLGVAHPGAISPATGLLKNSNSVCLNGQPLDVDLQRRLDRVIRFENDANCLGLSEATDGAGAGSDVVFSVILGTGVGGAIVAFGKIIRGANAISGEWGHNPLPLPADDERPGPACYCGLHGCIETWLSGPALSADHERVTGEKHIAREIVAMAAAGDLAAEATLERYERRLSRALATVINLLDPDVIVLGGGISNIDRIYDNVPKLWDEHVFSDHVATRLAKSVHGDSSGVRGAAWLGRG